MNSVQQNVLGWLNRNKCYLLTVSSMEASYRVEAFVEVQCLSTFVELST